MKKIFALVIFVVVIAAVAGIYMAKAPSAGAAVEALTGPTITAASSTTFTLTTTSQRLLATTTTKRLAATIQPVNCSTGSTVFMKADRDAVATANTGIAAFATTTMAFGDYPEIPVVQGSVQGITNAGTCTVLVTEWRSIR